MTRLNEGFWDAIVTKAKRVGLAAGAVAGSRKAQGKLNAENLALDFYNAFQVYKGETGDDDMASFLEQEMLFGPEFSQQWAAEFEEFSEDPQGYLSGDNGVEIDSTATGAEPETAAEPEAEQQPTEEPAGSAEAPSEEQIEQDRQELIDMGLTKQPNGVWNGETPEGNKVEIVKKGENYSVRVDNEVRGNVPIGRVVWVAKQLMNAGKMTDAPPREHQPEPSDEEKADQKFTTTVRDARDLLRGRREVTVQELSKELKISILDANKVLTKLERDGDVEEVGENDYDVLMAGLATPGTPIMESYRDGELRKFFKKLAQSAMKSGAAKSAASKELKHVKRPKSATQAAAPAAAQATAGNAPASTASEPEAPATPATAPVPGLNLSSDEKEELVALQDNPGWENLIKVQSNKEAEALARKIVMQAAKSLTDAQKKKK